MFDFSKSLGQVELNLEKGYGAYFVYDSILQKAYDNESFLNIVNENIYFWHSITYSLQSTYFICLGKVFDDSAVIPSINSFLNSCTQNISIFSKQELWKRKLAHFDDQSELQEYVGRAYFPTTDDFKHVKSIVKTYKKEYDNNYKDIRNKVFGHSEITKKDELEAVFVNTSRVKLEEIFMFLKHLLVELFSLYNNGHKIELQSYIYSNSFNLYKKIREDSEKTLLRLCAL